MLLGGHISVQGGVGNAPKRGRDADCAVMQIFSKNQMQWKAKPLDLEEAERFKQQSTEHAIRETVIHDSYLINLASPKRSLLKQSREAFLDEMVRARHLGVRYLIFHPGNHMGSGEQKGMKTIAESLNWARAEFGSDEVQQILEITAGQKTVMGCSFEQLRKIIDMLDDQKSVGICFDTAHAYGSGYDIKTPKGYEKTFVMLEDIIGLEFLKAMHLNDSKVKLGSKVDRHEQIGKGFIGSEGFRNFMNDDRWHATPMILETPEGEKGYPREIELLKSLVKRQ